MDRVTETARAADIPPEISVPPDWTVFYHGSNLGRDEWQGGKRNLLDADILVNQAPGIGLSCITREAKQHEIEENRRMGSHYDTTQGFSTVSGDKIDEPLEIRIAFPAFHTRTGAIEKARDEYAQKYGPERTQEIVNLADRVHWKINQQHPVLPRGMKLVKLQDYVDKNRRVVSYVPEELKDIYEKELAQLVPPGNPDLAK